MIEVYVEEGLLGSKDEREGGNIGDPNLPSYPVRHPSLHKNSHSVSKKHQTPP